jgi:hypothetical protein
MSEMKGAFSVLHRRRHGGGALIYFNTLSRFGPCVWGLAGGAFCSACFGVSEAPFRMGRETKKNLKIAKIS